MSGIKLTFDKSGHANIVKEVENQKHCMIDHCDLVQEDWICGHSGLSIWDYYRDPGWCPLFKWFRTSRNKEFNDAIRNKNRKSNS